MPEIVSPDVADARVLALFEQAGSVATPTPGVRAWLARDVAMGTPVLLKRLRSDGTKARATTALQLAHPNIVRTRRWFSEGGHLYIVRDVVRGKNLRQALGELSFRQTPELLEKLLLPILAALEVAHGRGVPHGGVSPENVLIADDGRVLLSDFAACDPSAPQHAPTYSGSATTAGDVRALGRVLVRFMPTGGPFASEAVRERVAGIVERCGSLADLRETLTALDKFATAPLPKASAPLPETPVIVAPPPLIGPPPLPPIEEDDTQTADRSAENGVTIEESPTNPAPWAQKTPTAAVPDPPVKPGEARLGWRPLDSTVPRVVRGGGGTATIVLVNEGDAPLTVRMIATQHAWLNVRPMELPLTLPAGASAPLDFTVSAARLAAGEYRSEVYVSANAGGRNAEDLRSGWFKHTAEVRVVVTDDRSGGGSREKPPYPANAPRIAAPPGCGIILFLGAATIASSCLWGIRLILS